MGIDSSDVVGVESKLIGGVKRLWTRSWNRDDLEFKSTSRKRLMKIADNDLKD